MWIFIKELKNSHGIQDKNKKKTKEWRVNKHGLNIIQVGCHYFHNHSSLCYRGLAWFWGGRMWHWAWWLNIMAHICYTYAACYAYIMLNNATSMCIYDDVSAWHHAVNTIKGGSPTIVYHRECWFQAEHICVILSASGKWTLLYCYPVTNN